MSGRKRVVVFISGSGSNMEKLAEACEAPGFPAEIVAVISPQNTPSQRLAEELGFSVWKETRWSGPPRLAYRARP